MTAHRYAVQYSALQTRLALPPCYVEMGLADEYFECLVDNGILKGVQGLIEAGLYPINSCSGLRVDHLGPYSPNPYLALYIPAKAMWDAVWQLKSPYRVVRAEDRVLVVGFRYKNDPEALACWSGLFSLLVAIPQQITM